MLTISYHNMSAMPECKADLHGTPNTCVDSCATKHMCGPRPLEAGCHDVTNMQGKHWSTVFDEAKEWDQIMK